jgi:hypothetical protein
MQHFCRIIRFISWVYLAILFGWLTAYLLAGDRIPYLGLVNLIAVNFFFPLPLVLLAALLCRSRSLAAGFLTGAAAFIWLWGALFFPKLPRASAAGPRLSVMTYNVLAAHRFTEPIIATIRAENPDIVFIRAEPYAGGRDDQADQRLPTRFSGRQIAQPDRRHQQIPLNHREQLPHRWIGDRALDDELEWADGSPCGLPYVLHQRHPFAEVINDFHNRKSRQPS